MKHARSDYDPIQDPRGKIPEDEPVLLLRGQDKLAVSAARTYAHHARLAGLNDVADRVWAHADAMEEWQRNRRCKLPDIDSAAAPFNPLRDGKPPRALPGDDDVFSQSGH